LRGKFKAYEYQSVILPIIVIRRLECVLLAWRGQKRAEVLARQAAQAHREGTRQAGQGLELNPKQCPVLEQDRLDAARGLRGRPRLLEKTSVLTSTASPRTLTTSSSTSITAPPSADGQEQPAGADPQPVQGTELGPDKLSGLEMGYIYEELLRRFSEQSGEEAGEHFTPREVIRLMVELLDIPIPDRHISIYDPACGTGGMLSVAKEHLLDRAATPARAGAGREVRHRARPGTVAHQLRHLPGRPADQERPAGQSPPRQLADPARPAQPRAGRPVAGPNDRFDFMLSNPPFGVTWGGKDGYETEARKLEKTRYRAGMPRTNDGALLFLQTMLAKMKPAQAEGGSRIAIIFNGSPLSNGDCGSGESEIRRWILENDWLDAIVMLPDQLFYNTGIFTYVWLLRNDKPASHRGR
jgi:type I restriction enzyme M protein